jgi:hypothetical protein
LPADFATVVEPVPPELLEQGCRDARQPDPGNRVGMVCFASDEVANPMRASARSNFGSKRVRIFAGSKALESRVIMTSWSSEQKDVMSETAGGHRRRKAYGSAKGKGSEG